MQVRILKKHPSGSTQIKSLLARCAMAVLLIAGAINLQTALAQTTQPINVQEADQILLRKMYYVNPELSDSLRNELEGVSDYNESRNIVRKYRDRVSDERDTMSKIPNKMIDNDRMDKFLWDHLQVEKYLDVMTDTRKNFTNEYRRGLNLEDDIIEKAHFSDYRELYAFLRKKYPKDRGGGFLFRLGELRKESQAKYVEALHGLINELKEFRAPSPKVVSPCKAICTSPAQPPQARVWCNQHCRDDVKN